MRGFRLLMLAVLVGLVVTAPAVADPEPGKDQCKEGGFAELTSVVGGEAFANQGQCVEFVNHGGTLVPVAPPVEASCTFVREPSPIANQQLTVTCVGLLPGSTVFVQTGSGYVIATGVVNAEGTVVVFVAQIGCGENAFAFGTNAAGEPVSLGASLGQPGCPAE